MKKEFRLLLGIFLHPVKKIMRCTYRKSENDLLLSAARHRQWQKNHERMHKFSFITNTAYTESPLYENMYAGAPERYEK